MKLILPDALHARPANLLVRAASRLSAVVWVHKGEARADAREILQVLKLGAAKGDEILLVCEHEESLAVVVELIERNFDADLVPETGSVAAAGIAIGEALVHEADETSDGERGSDEEEIARATAAFARAKSDVATMIATLPKREAELFEPELSILDALEPKVLMQIAAGASVEDAVRAEAVLGHFDLIDDARARLLDALSGTGGAIARKLAERTVDVVLVTTAVTPSLVASLPSHVVGVIVGVDSAGRDEGRPSSGTTSHAAILARGRALPLAYVESHVAYSIEDAVVVVLDTTSTPARVWAAPSEALLTDARARRDALRSREAEEGLRAEAPLALVAVRVNVGSSRDELPLGAEGIGLLRTELVFADRVSAPREEEQSAAYSAIAKKVTGPVLIRLFDAGGDKPLPFLPGDLRGVALLRANPSVLAAQLCAIAKVEGDARVLIPLVRDADDVEAVRLLAGGRKVGAMIETPEAALGIDAIARVSDFICIGTNDLAAETLGLSREHAPNPLDPRVLAHVRRTVEGAHAHGRKVTVCGEIAADPEGARILVGLGVDALSVAPARFASLKLSLQNATIDECRAAAERALKANAS